MVYEKSHYKAFSGSRRSCLKFYKFASREAMSVGAEDFKFNNEKKTGGVERSKLDRPQQPANHLCLRLAAQGNISIIHQNCQVSRVTFWVE